MRTKAKTGWERSVQVLRWLIKEFSLPGNLRIELVDSIDGDETLGRVVERNGSLVVQLSRKMCRSVHTMVEVTIHEAAHVKLYDEGLGYLHGPRFWEVFGQMQDSFDHHGHLDSRTFSVD